MKIKHGFQGERFIIVPYQHLVAMQRSPLCSDLYIQSLGHFPNAKYHYINRVKGLREHILIYCKSGNGCVSIEGQMHNLAANQVIIIPPGVAHSYWADQQSPWSIYWIHFAGVKAPLFARGFETPATIQPSPASRIEERIKLFDEMYTALSSKMTVETVSYANLCLPHFLGTFSFVKQFRAAGKTAEHTSTIISVVVYYMQENVDGRLSLQDMSAYVGMSKSYFYRVFLREMGESPVEYFNRLKVQKACDYIMYSDMNIVQIAHTVGFSDPYYFSRVFSRIMGVPPTRFRAIARDELKL